MMAKLSPNILGFLFPCAFLVSCSIEPENHPDDPYFVLSATREEFVKAINNGWSVTGHLYAAALSRDPSIVELFIANGANVNERSEKLGSTALHAASSNNQDPRVIDVLVENGAALNARDLFGRTPFHESVSNPNPEIIYRLAENGADIQARNNKGETALFISASNNGTPAQLSAFIELGLDVNDKLPSGKPILIEACAKSGVDTVRTLVEAGFRVNVNEPYLEWTPLTRAICSKSRESKVAQYLLDAGANVSGVAGFTALHAVSKYSKDEQLLADIISKGVDLNARDSNGMTALMYAAKMHDNPSFVRLLVGSGSNTDAQDKSGMNALMHACDGRNGKGGQRVLPQPGEFQDKRKFADNREFYLRNARYGNEQNVQQLIQLGANLNLQDHSGNTSLMYSITLRNKKILEILVDAGVDVHLANQQGDTALDLIENRYGVLKETNAYWKIRESVRY
jgi:ankyrin repeat protein